MAVTNVTGETDAAACSSAIILPFPGRRVKAVPAGQASVARSSHPQPPVPLSSDPQARLVRALESLDAALSNQRAAVTAWRGVLKDLKSTTAHLDESLQRYRTSLRSLGSSVTELHNKARTLEEWADKVSHTEN